MSSEICPRCQRLHVSATGGRCCTGHRRRDGEPCSKNALKGQDVCGSHGGQAPQAKAAAARRVERERSERIMATYAQRAEDRDPGELLLDLIAWAHGKVIFCREQVSKLEPADMIWGRTKRSTGGENPGDTYEAKPHAWIVQLNEAERDLARYTKDAVVIGLKARELDMVHQLSERYLQLMDAVVRELGHDPNDPQTAEKVHRAFRVIEGGLAC